MGCDGGTIPKRDELVKTKRRPEQKDKVSDLAFRWRHCAISQEALAQPYMACELGRLYNKESVLEFLLDRSKFECAESFSHLRGLKDLKELQLTENPAAKKKSAEKGDGYIDMQVSDFICPIAGVEMNGIYRFCFLWTCGCVFSERAMKEIKSQTCHKCGKPCTENDIVMLNGTEEDGTANKYKMDYRRVQAKLAKKGKKNGKRSAPAETTTSTSQDEASSMKRLCPDSETPSTSATASSELSNGTTQHKAKSASVSSGGTKLTNGSKAASKMTNGSRPAGEGKTGKTAAKTIQDDPNASQVYKSLFNTCDKAKRQTQGHWVTFNPQYF